MAVMTAKPIDPAAKSSTGLAGVKSPNRTAGAAAKARRSQLSLNQSPSTTASPRALTAVSVHLRVYTDCQKPLSSAGLPQLAKTRMAIIRAK